MTAEEMDDLDRRFAAHEATIRALVAQFVEPTKQATRIMAASEERAKEEREAYDKRAAEHDAQAKAQHERNAAQHERATEALSLQRRNVEAWERIAGALERFWPQFNFNSGATFQQPFGAPCSHFNTETRTDGRYCTVCGQRVGE
jgi:hypothetical protein